MVTGCFPGTFSSVSVSFMVDTGSELSLISRDCYSKSNLPVDLDGTRWSLKGIHGWPVPLGGCICDVPLAISGHRFDHHFLVSEEDMGNRQKKVILGQPWLQWYTACISYTHAGAMNMCLWQNSEGGASSFQATVSIPLCAPDSPRNKYSISTPDCKHPPIEKAQPSTLNAFELISQCPHRDMCPAHGNCTGC